MSAQIGTAQSNPGEDAPPKLLVFATTDDLPFGAVQRFGSDRFRVPGWYKSIAFSHDSRLIYVKADQQVTVLDRESGHAIRDLRLSRGIGSVWKMAASDDGESLALAMSDFPANQEAPNNRIEIVSANAIRRRIIPWPEQRWDVKTLGFNGDRSVLFVATGNGLRFWDLKTGEPIERPTLQELQIDCAAFSPDGKTLVVGGWQKCVIWQWQTDEAPREIENSSSKQPLTVKFSPDGMWFAMSNGYEAWVRIYDALTGKLAWKLESEGKRAHADGGLAFTPDSSQIAVPFSTGDTVELWDMRTQRRVHVFESKGPRTVAISPDGQWLAAAGGNSGIDLWNLKSREQVKRPAGHESQIEQLEFTADDRQLISASSDGTVRVWDVTSGQQVHLLDYRHAEGRSVNYVRGLAISPDGNQVVASALDDTVAIWDRATGELKKKVPEQDLRAGPVRSNSHTMAIA